MVLITTSWSGRWCRASLTDRWEYRPTLAFVVLSAVVTRLRVTLV